jgi:Ankyrin repeats (3 copies)
VAGARVQGDPFGTQASVGSAAGSEAPFRGRPFAPRDIRIAAGSNDVEMLRDYLEQRPGWVDKSDKNDWSPIHFAARAGNAEAVKVLLEANVDVNKRNNQGVTALGMALEKVGENHPLTALLRNHGGQV